MILHLDMDAFFASVEQHDDPSLRGRPVLVGGTGPRAVVSAASYEARRFGCRSAMPMAEALRRCPDAVVRPVRGARYAELAREVMVILHDASPLVERLSIDEAFVDLSGTERLHRGSWREVADRIRAKIRCRLDLPSSAGVASNKFLAKLASDLAKPDGTLVVDAEWMRTTLPTLPVARLWGVGPATERRLVGMGLRTFDDIVRAPVELVRQAVGDGADRLRRLAAGEDDRAVVPERDAKSIGAERTFSRGVPTLEPLRAELLHQVEEVAERLRADGLCTRTITLKVRLGDFSTTTRRTTFVEPLDDTVAIWAEAETLLRGWIAERRPGETSDLLPEPVRLIGIALSGLVGRSDAETLFVDATRARRRAADAVADAVRQRFGRDAIRRGGAATRRRKDGSSDDS